MYIHIKHKVYNKHKNIYTYITKYIQMSILSKCSKYTIACTPIHKTPPTPCISRPDIR